MANLTLAIDDAVLRRARIRAVSQDTSVNALVREYLAGYGAADPDHRSTLDELTALADAAKAGSGPGGRSWKREDLYDRPGLR
ncbi:MAG: hypothetical protein LBG60_16460 [Bifidobacteriaceae bacterium]|jgi:plasmid stability protein|nr:hypothetical protein [Bifidobacteriaceae bacterium]